MKTLEVIKEDMYNGKALSYREIKELIESEIRKVECVLNDEDNKLLTFNNKEVSIYERSTQIHTMKTSDNIELLISISKAKTHAGTSKMSIISKEYNIHNINFTDLIDFYNEVTGKVIAVDVEWSFEEVKNNISKIIGELSFDDLVIFIMTSSYFYAPVLDSVDSLLDRSKLNSLKDPLKVYNEEDLWLNLTEYQRDYIYNNRTLIDSVDYRVSNEVIYKNISVLKVLSLETVDQIRTSISNILTPKGNSKKKKKKVLSFEKQYFDIHRLDDTKLVLEYGVEDLMIEKGKLHKVPTLYSSRIFDMKDKRIRDLVYLYLANNTNSPAYGIIFIEMVVVIYKALFLETDLLYKKYTVKTPTKYREIYEPKPSLMTLSRKILNIISNGYFKSDFIIKGDSNTSGRKPNDFQFGYREGLSIYDNVLLHKDNKYVMKFDIKGFFDGCTFEKVRRRNKFLTNGVTDNNKNGLLGSESSPIHKATPLLISLSNLRVILDACFYTLIINPNTGGIYQGNPLSGILSNLIIKGASNHLKNIFNKYDIKFSIYADDITLSSNIPFKYNGFAKEMIDGVFETHGLSDTIKLNTKKTRLLSNNRRHITGLSCNHNDEIVVKQRTFKMLRTKLVYLKYGKPITDRKREFLGMYQFIASIERRSETARFKKLEADFGDVLEKVNAGSLDNLFVGGKGYVKQ